MAGQKPNEFPNLPFGDYELGQAYLFTQNNDGAYKFTINNLTEYLRINKRISEVKHYFVNEEQEMQWKYNGQTIYGNYFEYVEPFGDLDPTTAQQFSFNLGITASRILKADVVVELEQGTIITHPNVEYGVDWYFNITGINEAIFQLKNGNVGDTFRLVRVSIYVEYLKP